MLCDALAGKCTALGDEKFFFFAAAAAACTTYGFSAPTSLSLPPSLHHCDGLLLLLLHTGPAVSPLEEGGGGAGSCANMTLTEGALPEITQ